MKKLFVFLVLVLLAYFVWPTRYEQYGPDEGPYAAQAGPGHPTRVDRLTGEIEFQDASGEWIGVGNARKAVAFQRPVVDPSATRRPSARHTEQIADQHQRSLKQTQNAVDSATEQAH
jgi:hypothetical protein